ncbi:MAG TPA: glycosyltransferase [Candidatus Paceibacterota bacterium]|nr:glycosyltransferase [Candidatus Paceibacterota bacterium]
MKPVLVHEYLNQYGGAERVLQVLSSMLPTAPIYTTLYDERLTGGVFRSQVIRTSFIQSLPGAKRWHHLYAPLMPMAVEQFDLRAFDTVVSVSASFAKGVITHPGTRHLCYCLTPPRFLWDDSQRFVRRFTYPLPIGRLSPLLLSYLRVWDQQAAARVDEWVAISEFVRRRIQKYYGRDSVVIHPPVNIAKFQLAEGPGTFWLMVGRFVAYKNFDLAIETFNRLGWPLKIVGTGVEERRLKHAAKGNIEFLGQVNDERLGDLYRQSVGVVFPQEEDFGIVPLEAMASGRPVVALRGGGALETIIDRITGVFFDEASPESLTDALERASRLKWLPNLCRGQAERFDVPVFRAKMHALIHGDGRR